MGERTPFRFIRDEEHYPAVLEEEILAARSYVKIATANVKEIRVLRGGKYRSILRSFEEMVERGVSIRILHGARPSERFRDGLSESRTLSRNERFEMMYCPRAHLKMTVVDSRFLYVGSANLTGAGLGVKKAERRNFETGFATGDETIVAEQEAVFDRIWSGAHCGDCGRKEFCE